MSKAENKKKLGEQFESAIKGMQDKRAECITNHEYKLKELDNEIELLELQRDAIKKV